MLRLFVVSLILILVGFLPQSVYLYQAFAFVARPFQVGMHSFSQVFIQEWDFWLRLRSLESERRYLESRILELESERSFFEEVYRENAVLRSQLGLVEEETYDQPHVLARVVGRSLKNKGGSLVIDQGTQAGVTAGDIVVLGSSLVGVVGESYSSQSEVYLLTDPQSKVAALDQSSPHRAKGVVVGRYETGLVMEDILPREEVRVGDIIISSGEGGTYPKGLMLGRVTSISSSESGILKTAELELFIDIRRLEEVFVIKP